LPGRLRGRLPAAEVLISHVPPRGILDACISGQHAGSDCLRKAVEKGATKPRVWLCGHIHEAAGAERVRFGRGVPATVVVNAANANPGLAKRLVLGPVVVDLRK
jgi:Icc-related predicted phosphoesterase